MAHLMQDSLIFEFDGFTLDLGRGTLRQQDKEIRLRPKSFELLRYLVEHSGQLMSKDELTRALWPNTFVGDDSLSRCISDVRLALNDDTQRIVKTVPKRGYLFAAPLSKAARVVESLNTLERGGPPRRATLEGASIAVLPFANLSDDPSQDYLSDGITEDIINGFSAFADLIVIARNSSFSYKGKAIDARAIGEQLGVRYLVEGSVRRFGDRIRVNARLVDAQSGTQRWSERFDRALGDIFQLQDEITQTIVHIVVAHVGRAERERAARKPPSSWTAYDLTLQGDQAMRTYVKSWSAPDLYQARKHFLEALKVDPDNAAVHAKLAGTYIRAYSEPDDPDYGKPNVLKTGYDLVRKAVIIDPNLPLTRAQLGWALSWMCRPDEAIEEFDRAFALNPNFSDIRFPAVLVYAGECQRALEAVAAHVRLDPFHPPFMYAFKGHALYMLQRYAEAVDPLRESLRRAPQVWLAHVWLAATYIRLGRRDEARAIAKDVLDRSPNMAVGKWPALALYKRMADADHMIAALREAGF